MKTVMIEEMSWSDFREAMSSNDLVIVPVGSVEEHGRHNPLGTDLLIARAVAEAVGQKVNAPVAPVMPIGNARNLMGFPGTAHLDPGILREVMVQVAESFIRAGAKRFLFINGHGGNATTLGFVCSDLFEKYGVIATHSEWWLTLPHMSDFKCNDHGGQFETSMMMAVNDKVVDMSKAKTLLREAPAPGFKFERALQFAGADISLPITLDKYTPQGNYGAEAEKANKALGEQMFETYVDYCAGLAGEMRKIIV